MRIIPWKISGLYWAKLSQALGDRKSITRYGDSLIPMDEALALVSLDLSNRPYLHFEVPFTASKIGDMETELLKSFQGCFSKCRNDTTYKADPWKNNHHVIEAVFKSLWKSFKKSSRHDTDIKGVMSTKGVL